MKLAILKERGDETRVAAIPETVKKFVALGGEVAIEKGAGEHASIADADYEAAGATIGERAPILKDADAILCVESEFMLTESNQALRGFFLLLPDPASLQVMLRALRLA